jgi:hypothetical protein
MRTIFIITLLWLAGLFLAASGEDTSGKTAAAPSVAPPAAAAPVTVAPGQTTEVKMDNGNTVNLNVRIKSDSSDDDDSYFVIDLPDHSGSKLFQPFAKGMKFGAGRFSSGGTGRFVFAPSWTISNAGGGYGMTYAFGGRGALHQVTGSFTWASGDNNYSIVGGGLEYDNYRWSMQNVINLVPGITAGFWYESWDTMDKTYNARGILLNSFSSTADDFYFGGPTLSLELGYGGVHLFGKMMVLFGSSVSFRQDYGLIFSMGGGGK